MCPFGWIFEHYRSIGISIAVSLSALTIQICIWKCLNMCLPPLEHRHAQAKGLADTAILRFRPVLGKYMRVTATSYFLYFQIKTAEFRDQRNLVRLGGETNP